MPPPDNDQPILKRRVTPQRPPGGAWLARALLAACLFFGAEVLLWTDAARPAWAWVPLLPGYLALAALTLDLFVRYRVREFYGGLVLAGAVGLLASGLLNPSITLANLPTTVVTRVMGAQTVAAGVGLLLFLAWVRGVSRRALWVGAGGAGLFWGVWARGYPLLLAADALPLAVVFGLAAGGGALVLAFAFVARPGQSLTAETALLSSTAWAGVLLVLGALGAFAMTRGALTRDGLSYLVILVFFCIVILWFQDDRNATSPLDGDRAGANPLADGIPALALFLAAGAVGYLLPLAESGALGALTVAFGVVGLAWLPAVCVVLAVRAYRTTSRTGKSL